MDDEHILMGTNFTQVLCASWRRGLFVHDDPM